VDYVSFLKFRPSLSAAERDGALMRRASWQYPAGMRVIAEYWPSSADVQVVSIFSVEEYGPVMELLLEWGDVFEIAVYPAVSAEDGLKIGPEAAGKIQRMAQT
jgi:hypothetical protein